jgi:hypothetical protein
VVLVVEVPEIPLAVVVEVVVNRASDVVTIV